MTFAVMKTLFLVTIALFLIGCSLSSAAQDTPRTTQSDGQTLPILRGDATEGAQIGQQWCSSCHAVSSQDPASDVGPTWTSRAGDPAKSDDYLTTFLTAPHWPMDNIALSRQEIAHVVAYIRTLEEEG